ncbi:MAG: imidazole glycerol phosphate synthase subunit HisH [Smithellaceae bacterium]
MIAIIDYGLGNIRSVIGAVKKVGFEPVLTADYDTLDQADKLILPGVGAFGDGMNNLRELGLVDFLSDLVLQKKKPILGICLGAQLLSKVSYEFGQHEGLGWLDAEVVPLTPQDEEIRIPHVGWNDFKKTKDSILTDGIPVDALFYYVHSYHIQCTDPFIIAGTCHYGITFTAAIVKENIYATQFHPEKSQIHGLKLLQNFLEKA